MNQLQLLIENNKKGLWKSGQKFTDHFPTGSAITIIVPTKQDICTLQKKGHFYFALTDFHFQLDKSNNVDKIS